MNKILFFNALFFSYSQSKIDSNSHLYLLIGQSNTAGRGEITKIYKLEEHPNVYMLNKSNKWVLAFLNTHYLTTILRL